MSESLSSLPSYLKKYVAEQKYEKYTAQEHAAWRYIMRQNRAFFSKFALPIYGEGVRKTGLPIDHIPRISEMDDCLSKFGWGAVPVRGFIPPAAFLDFQARGILPIACDMRTVNHIAYTPAPDIVHEAAGHAPIVADPQYAAYLHRYAQMAQKAIQSIEDIRVYEAIRYLSDIKENPDESPRKIAQAEARLKTVSAAISHVSEATRVARMAWWTVEYGLAGSLKSPSIYGAGLLSSVGESQLCLSDKVKKIPLTLDCVETSYNITEPQPQLFVTPNLDHLTDVLEDLESTLAYKMGGIEGMTRAMKSETVNTVVLDTGIEIGGKVVDFIFEKSGEISFFKLAGPSQFAVKGKEIPGQGIKRHTHGFSSPLGHFEPPEKKLEIGKRAKLNFSSGFILEGTLAGKGPAPNKPLFLTFSNCSISRGDTVYFEPAWGEFDLVLGQKIVSVHGGPPDRESFGDLDIGSATTIPARTTPFSTDEKVIHSLYGKLRDLRGSNDIEKPLLELATNAEKQFEKEWLASIEVLELIERLPKGKDYPFARRIRERLRERARVAEQEERDLIEKGLALVAVGD